MFGIRIREPRKVVILMSLLIVLFLYSYFVAGMSDPRVSAATVVLGVPLVMLVLNMVIDWSSTSEKLKTIWDSQLARLRNDDGNEYTPGLLEDVLRNFLSVHPMVVSTRKSSYCAMYMDKINYIQDIIRTMTVDGRAMPREMEEEARKMLKSLVKESGL